MAASLTVPSDRKAPPETLEVKPRRLKAWLDTLPLTNSLECARRACDHVHALNRAKLDLDLRLDLLDVHSAFAETVLEDLDTICARSAVPLSARARCALALAQELARELALGYKVAAAEARGRLLGFGAKRQVLGHLGRVMHFLGVALRAGQRSHAPAPKGLWRELHEIYLYAEQEGLAGQSTGDDAKSTLAQTYCEWLLLALADPYRLARAEGERILAELRRARIPLMLGKTVPATPRAAHFIVDCESDEAPRPAREADETIGGSHWRILDANALVEALRVRKGVIANGALSGAAARALGPDPEGLLERLITLWGERPQRAFERERVESSVSICVGFRAITQWVAGQLSALDQAAANEWAVLDRSARGVKVRRAASHAYPVGVGEVVAIQWSEKPQRTIAVVRWVMLTEEGGVEAGLQLLGDITQSVSILPADAGEFDVRPALVLEPSDPAHPGEALLAAPGTFDRREMALEGREAVRATRLVEKSGRFELFGFAATQGAPGSAD
jgi:hypothetical protein